LFQPLTPVRSCAESRAAFRYCIVDRAAGRQSQILAGPPASRLAPALAARAKRGERAAVSGERDGHGEARWSINPRALCSPQCETGSLYLANVRAYSRLR